MPTRKNTSNKSLSFSETKDVSDDAFSKCEKCQEDAMFSSGSIAISMKKCLIQIETAMDCLKMRKFLLVLITC